MNAAKLTTLAGKLIGITLGCFAGRLQGFRLYRIGFRVLASLFGVEGAGKNRSK